MDDILLINFMKDFDIPFNNLNLEKENIKLCNLLHIYELVERVSFERLLSNINPEFMQEINEL